MFELALDNFAKFQITILHTSSIIVVNICGCIFIVVQASPTIVCQIIIVPCSIQGSQGAELLRQNVTHQFHVSCLTKATLKKKKKEGLSTFPHKTSLKKFLYNCKCSYKKIQAHKSTCSLSSKEMAQKKHKAHKNSQFQGLGGKKTLSQRVKLLATPRHVHHQLNSATPNAKTLASNIKITSQETQ